MAIVLVLSFAIRFDGVTVNDIDSAEDTVRLLRLLGVEMASHLPVDIFIF